MGYIENRHHSVTRKSTCEKYSRFKGTEESFLHCKTILKSDVFLHRQHLVCSDRLIQNQMLPSHMLYAENFAATFLLISKLELV